MQVDASQLRSRAARPEPGQFGTQFGAQQSGGPLPVVNAWGAPTGNGVNSVWGAANGLFEGQSAPKQGFGARAGAEEPEKPLSQQDKQFVALLVGALFCLNADQGLPSPNLSLIADDFGFDSVQRDRYIGGLTQLGFFIIGGAVSVIIGPMVEVYPRKMLFCGVIVAGILPSAFMIFVPSSGGGFVMFLLARTCSGIAIGGSFPIIYSILGDVFPQSQRTLVATLVGTSTASGVAIGQAVAGLLGGRSGWRFPFLLFALGSFAFVAAIMTTGKEPKRKRKEKDVSLIQNEATAAWGVAEAAPELDYSALKKVLRTPTNKLLFMQGLPGQMGWSVIATFFIDFLHVEHGLSIAAATGLMGVFGISALGWSIAGGSLGQTLYNRRRAMVPMLLTAVYAVAPFPMLGLVWLPLRTESGGFGFMAILVAALAGVAAATGPNVKALLMNVNSSARRGTVFGAFTLMDDLGKGAGPTVVCVLIAIGGRAFAFSVAFMLWWLCAGLCWNVQFCLDDDARACEKEDSKDQDP